MRTSCTSAVVVVVVDRLEEVWLWWVVWRRCVSEGVLMVMFAVSVVAEVVLRLRCIVSACVFSIVIGESER